MKTNIKRLLCLALALTMIFSIVGCGKAKKANEDESFDLEIDVKDDKAATEEKAQMAVSNADALSFNDLVAQMPAKLKGTTVNVYSWNPPKDVTGAEKVIENFKQITGIDVKWTVGSYENYEQEIAAKINSGDSPDLIRYISPNIPRMYLTQDVKSASGYDFAGDIWDKTLTSAYTIKGKIYGVNLKNTFNQQPTVICYAKSTIERYKLDDPYTLWKSGSWTWDKFKDMCKTFKEQSNHAGWMTTNHLDPFWFDDVNLITFDGKQYKSNLSDPKVLTTLQQCCNNLNTYTCEAMRESDKLENGTYLFETNNILTMRRTDPHYPNLKANDDIFCVPVPTQAGKTFYQAFHEYEAYGMPKGCKNGPGAYYFLRYYLNKENYDAKMFFCNDQALESYNWCMSQTKVHYVVDRWLTKSVGTENAGLDTAVRTGLTAAQAKNKLDEVSPIVERAAKQGNELLAKFN